MDSTITVAITSSDTVFVNLDYIVDSNKISPDIHTEIKNLTKYNDNFRIYPNPTSGKIYIEIKSDGKEQYHIDIFDLTGRVLKTNLIEENGYFSKLIDISNLPKGSYFLILKSAKRYSVTRLVYQ